MFTTSNLHFVICFHNAHHSFINKEDSYVTNICTFDASVQKTALRVVEVKIRIQNMTIICQKEM